MKKKEEVRTFLIVFSILLFLYLWDGFLSGNEAQTLANVYHFANPGWLGNDWFLSLDTVYRIPFNIILFPLAKIFNLTFLALFSRIFLIGAMSLSLTYFFNTIRLTPGSIALFTLIAFRMKGMLAGEDMLWHVEAKVLSYSLVIAGLASFLKEKYRKMWLFLGGAAIFHPLVGGYSVIALVFSFPLYRNKKNPELIKNSPFFIVTGWPGIGIILYNLITSRGASGGVADLIYVARHPHHMIPTDFIRYVHKSFPAWMDYTIITGNVIFCAAVLIIAFIKLEKNSRERQLLYYTIGSFGIFLVGLLFYLTGQFNLLKYYPFRFPDVIIPFTAYFLFFRILDKHLFIKKPIIGIIAAAAVIGASGFLFTVTTVSTIDSTVPISLIQSDKRDTELYIWIKNNTPKDAVFIILPFIDNFNITAERAQFVTLKHIPQNERDVMEWYDRLKQLNNGRDFYDNRISFDFSNFKNNYFMLSDVKIKETGAEYGLDYYIGLPDREGDLPLVYSNDKWGVYRTE